MNAARSGVYAVLSCGVLALMDMSAKILASSIPIVEIVFFRHLFGLIFLLLLTFGKGEWIPIRSADLISHTPRAVCGVLSLVGIFYGLSKLSLADVVAIGFSSPLFAVALSRWILGEPLRFAELVAMCVGVVGVLIIVRPSFQFLNLAGLTVVAASGLHALSNVFIRRLSCSYTDLQISYYYSLISVIMCGVIVPFFLVDPTGPELILLAIMGCLGGLGQILLTTAYRLSAVAVVAPLTYSSVLFAAGIDYLAWGTYPGENVVVGAAIIAASGFYIVHGRSKSRECPKQE